MPLYINWETESPLTYDAVSSKKWAWTVVNVPLLESQPWFCVVLPSSFSYCERYVCSVLIFPVIFSLYTIPTIKKILYLDIFSNVCSYHSLTPIMVKLLVIQVLLHWICYSSFFRLFKLAMSTASPISRGHLAEINCWWNLLCAIYDGQRTQKKTKVYSQSIYRNLLMF
jgi:hypothetical protein